MKKKYSSPELELKSLMFERILQQATQGLNVSYNESGTDDHNDDDTSEW